VFQIFAFPSLCFPLLLSGTCIILSRGAGALVDKRHHHQCPNQNRPHQHIYLLRTKTEKLPGEVMASHFTGRGNQRYLFVGAGFGDKSGFSATPTAHGFPSSVSSNVASFSPCRFARVTRCASVVSL
jgi:hypothetical protein